MGSEIKNGPPNKPTESPSLAERIWSRMTNEFDSTEKTIFNTLQKIGDLGDKEVFLSLLNSQNQILQRAYKSIGAFLENMKDTKESDRAIKKVTYGEQILKFKEEKKSLEDERRGIADLKIHDIDDKIDVVKEKLKKIEKDRIEEKLLQLRYELRYFDLNYKISEASDKNKQKEGFADFFIERQKKEQKIKDLELELSKAKGMAGSTRDQEKLLALTAEMHEARDNIFKLQEEKKGLESKRFSMKRRGASEKDLLDIDANIKSLNESIKQAEERLKRKQTELREF